MKPAMVTPKNEQRVRRKLFHLQPEKSKWKFKVGQQVRISKRCQAFEKEYIAVGRDFYLSPIDSPPFL